MDRIFGSSVAMLLIIGLAFCPCILPAQPGNQVLSPLTSSSNAVTAAATTNLVSLLNKQGKAQAVDVRGAIVALDTYYAEMQATGANDRIQRAILDGQDAYINYGLSHDQAELAYSLATKSGIIVDRNQFEGTLQQTSSQRREQIAYLKRVGMRGIEQRFLGLLRSLESQMESGALS